MSRIIHLSKVALPQRANRAIGVALATRFEALKALALATRFAALKTVALVALLALVAPFGAGACAHTATFVKAPDLTLGRVVVYRNGIAYYERRAQIVSDQLVLRVPADKIDDFLKSLTVNDAKTGQALPVSFPTQRASAEGEVEMTVQVAGGQGREVVLTYVTESPSWKPSYRVIMSPGGQVDLQGWAVVDNTSGEDWQAVKVGVGASSALSFRFDLRSVRMVKRELLHTQDRFAIAPPRGGSLIHEGPRQEVVLDQLADGDIPRQAGHPQTEMSRRDAHGGSVRSGGRGHRAAGGRLPNREPLGSRTAAARPAAPSQSAAQQRRIISLAQSLRKRRGTIVLEGYAGEQEKDAKSNAYERANLLRNQLIMNGVPPAQIKVESRGAVPGQRAGVRIVEQPALPAEAQMSASRKEDAGAAVGESHFESKTPMTVPRGTSAMVSIVQGKAAGEAVYLYDPESGKGSSRYAFKAIRFRNPTGSTLESGPVTVYGQGRFIGEGLTEAIPPGAQAVVPFALDRQVVVDSSASGGDRIARLIKLNRGVLTAEVQHSRNTKLKIVNRMANPATVLIRRTIPKGWKLIKGPKTSERFGEAHIFEVRLGPSSTAVVELEEATPMVRFLDLRSPVGLDLVRVYLQAPQADAGFAAAMAKLLKLHAAMVQHEETIDNLRQRGEEYRQRNDELHVQILSLKAVKAKGPLIQHLETKMKEISQRLQANTIAIVDHQEKVMVAKVQFQDGLAELTIEKRTVSHVAR